MKIAICSLNPYWHGLANNGGSQTILRSAETLNKMGHQAVVVTKTDNFNWFPHKKPVKEIPADADICIAAAVSDIKPMIEVAPKGSRLAYWARPAETWQMPEKKCLKQIRKIKKRGGVIMANSQWQINWMADNGIDAELVYQGLDFDRWRRPQRPHDRKGIMKIGCLYSKLPRKRWADCKYIKSQLRPKQKLVILGKKRHITGDALVKLYQSVQIWLAPTTLEGFHNVPAEAALCGALVVVSDNPRNGCMDYCTPETAHIYQSIGEVPALLEEPDYSRVPKMIKLLADKVGSREKNMAKMIGVLEKC